MDSTGSTVSLLDASLRIWEERFDEELNLIRGEVGPVRYHTRLEPGSPVHQTRESAEFAAALLEHDAPAGCERAAAILESLLPLQDSVAGSPTCGIWPWFYEEPLDKMSPPDWNWADFIGAQLAQILFRNSARLSPDLIDKLRESLRLAARSIMKRDVRLSYTNIAIMGGYVTTMAGRILGEPEIHSYGKNRLKKLAGFTKNFGGFPEYNSPAYYPICLMELGRMLRDFSDGEEREIARDLHDMVWGEIAMHWHGPSAQWAGPHSRSYSTLLKVETLAFLQQGLGTRAAIGGKGAIPSPDRCSLPVNCPDRFIPFFLETAPIRSLRQPISESEPALEAHMHMEPGFVLSSAERATFWNQSRGLIAYGSSPSGPAAMTLRFLHDGYDFCAANLLTCQDQNRVLAGICLAHDAGDVHGDLDRSADRKLQASDWRLRLEFFHHDIWPIPQDWSLGKPQILRFGSHAWMGVLLLSGEFGEASPRFETGSDPGRSWIDLIFYHGEKRLFHFGENFPCFAGLAIMIAGSSELATDVGRAHAVRSSEGLQLEWVNESGRIMHLESPVFPKAESEILSWAHEQKARRRGGACLSSDLV